MVKFSFVSSEKKKKVKFIRFEQRFRKIQWPKSSVHPKMKRLQIYFLQWKVSKNAIYNDRDYVDVRPEHVAITTVALSKFMLASDTGACRCGC